MHTPCTVAMLPAVSIFAGHPSRMTNFVCFDDYFSGCQFLGVESNENRYKGTMSICFDEQSRVGLPGTCNLKKVHYAFL